MNRYRAMVVDDVEQVVSYVRTCLEMDGNFEVECFTSANSLFEKFVPGTVDVVLADLEMPGMHGGELQSKLAMLDPGLSFVVMTGRADVKTAVQLMERGTFTLLEKPFTKEEIVTAATKAAKHTRDSGDKRQGLAEGTALLATLSEEECEVLSCLLEGHSNKAVVQRLAISSRTLDRRRAKILEKLKVDSFAEVIALVVRTRWKWPLQ
jgi:FixJ family two-component response regulator